MGFCILPKLVVPELNISRSAGCPQTCFTLSRVGLMFLYFPQVAPAPSHTEVFFLLLLLTLSYLQGALWTLVPVTVSGCEKIILNQTQEFLLSRMCHASGEKRNKAGKWDWGLKRRWWVREKDQVERAWSTRQQSGLSAEQGGQEGIQNSKTPPKKAGVSRKEPRLLGWGPQGLIFPPQLHTSSTPAFLHTQDFLSCDHGPCLSVLIAFLIAASASSSSVCTSAQTL